MFLFSEHAVAQKRSSPPSGFIEMKPAWKNGDERVMTSQVRFTMTMGDTLPMEVSSSAATRIRINDVRSDRYVIGMRNVEEVPLSLSMDMGLGDTLNTMIAGMTERLMAFTEPFKRVELKYAVSREGEVLELLDEAKVWAEMRKAFLEGMSKVAPQENLSMNAEIMIDSLLEEQLTTLLEVHVNQLNVLFAGHLYSYPTNGTYREPALFTQVDAPMLDHMEEIPGWVELRMIEQGIQKLVGQVELIYDKDTMSEALRKRHPDSKIPMDELDMREVRTYTFDRSTGWITGITEFITFNLPGLLKGHHVTTTTLTKP